MPEDKTLSIIISEINDRLRAYGKTAVQEVKMTNREGKVIGQIRFGYRPQYVFDSINAVLLPENWRYEVISKDIFNQQAVVEVKLFIRIGDGWLCKGSQIGQMQIVKENIGDAYKGSITDALQKCFSLLSIGTDAYRGLLESVYKGLSQPIASNRQPVQQPAVQPETPSAETFSQPQKSQPTQDNQDLPQITGVHIQRVDNRFIAKGQVYNKKEMLKAAGFKWDGATRTWFKDAAAAVH
ncbi:MAG: hypothetical protein P4L50_08520 [Anaerolineaceae bacterium]|nr:hypothetical protein [Anaerolineaceae bacterium]